MACERSIMTPRIVFGASIIGVGVVFLLDNLGIADARELLRYWPVVLIGVGLTIVVQRSDTSAYLGGGAWMLIGTLLLLSNLRVLVIRGRDLWPVMLIGVGAYLVWQAVGGPRRERRSPQVTSTTGDASVGRVPESDERFHAVAIMGGAGRRMKSASFAGGDATAIMGGCEIDLRSARIGATEAVIDVFALWGGIEIRVPEDWVVIAKVLPLMGVFEDKTRTPATETTQRLVVRGMAFMGGIEVKN